MGSGTITLEIVGLRSDRGRVLVSLYDRAAGFPDRPEGRVRQVGAAIAERRAEVSFEGLRSGRAYAAVAFHDENDDGELSRNLAGLPREGRGLSNVPANAISPRDFDSAHFFLVGEGVTVRVEIRYIL